MCRIQKGVGAKLQPWMDYTENYTGSVGGPGHTEPLFFASYVGSKTVSFIYVTYLRKQIGSQEVFFLYCFVTFYVERRWQFKFEVYPACCY